MISALNNDLKKFFTHAFEYKSDFQQFHLVVDEKEYKKLKQDFLKFHKDLEDAADAKPAVTPDPKPESRGSSFKGSYKAR